VRTVSYIAAGSLASAALASMVWGARAGTEVWLGMLAPLLVVIVTWTMIERVYRQHPERLTAVMMKAFAGKLVFFGAYVGVVIGVMRARPIPFIVSFTAYFIALHLVEALCMKRMFVS
jgi:hypothetical protein